MPEQNIIQYKMTNFKTNCNYVCDLTKKIYMHKLKQYEYKST